MPDNFGFQFDAANSIGLTAADVLDVQATDGGSLLQISMQNFEAGDKLVFTIDAEHDLGFSDDPIASGAEFELSTLTATFVDPNYFVDPVQTALDVTDPNVLAGLQGTEDGIFWNNYDGNFAGTALVGKLPADNFTNAQGQGQADRTAGAMGVYELTPRPIEISGNVFHDRDLDAVRDAGEEGIQGVSLTLQYKQDATGSYQDVLDGNGQTATAVTDADGNYSFGINDGLKLAPGFYRIIESDPSDFEISVAAIPGTVHPSTGLTNGQVDSSDPTNIITDIHIPFGDHEAVNYDFAEAKTVTLSGTVFHDRNLNEVQDVGDEGIADVELTLFYRADVSQSFTAVLDAQGNPVTTRTDSNGNYSFGIGDGLALPAGIYRIVETQPTGFDVSVAAIPGLVSSNTGLAPAGQEDSQDPTNIITEINIPESDQHAVFLDFAEAKTVTLSGTVFHDRNLNEVQDIGDEGIVDVELTLFYRPDATQSFAAVLDAQGNPVTTRTDSDGHYSFGINDGLALPPGIYRIVETQPAGFDVSVAAIPGLVSSTTGLDPTGQTDPQDPTNILTEINVSESDQHAVFMDFAEAKTVAISGNVHLSNGQGDCFGPGHPEHRPVEGARVYLVSDRGDVWVTETDADGNYSFEGTGLLPGSYTLIEVTPDNLFDGSEFVGAVNGLTNGVVDQLTEIPLSAGGVLLVSNIVEPGEIGRLDFITQIELSSGDRGVEYHFCEHEGSSISGYVYEDLNNNGVRDSGEGPVQQSVRMFLLDDGGNQIADTTTDAQGFYIFENLAPGTYMVRQGDVTGYFDGKDTAGTVNGLTVGEVTLTADSTNILRDNDKINEITLAASQDGIEYNFGELPGSSLSGFVFHDLNNDGVFDPGETPLEGVSVELRLTFSTSTSGVSLTPDYVLDPSVLDSQGRYVVTTAADGSYSFEGIRGGPTLQLGNNQGVLGGNYAVYQLNQPNGFNDGLDAPGSTGGLADNFDLTGQNAPASLASLLQLHTNSGARQGDLLVSVPVGIAQSSVSNNFGEVLPPSIPPELPPSTPNPLPPPSDPPTLRPPTPTGTPPLLPQAPLPSGAAFGAVDAVVPLRAAQGAPDVETFAWHLSVLNGGNPRGGLEVSSDAGVWHSASYLDKTDWSPENLREAVWTLPSDIAPQTHSVFFGIAGALPIVGDFNGDGLDEIGVYYQGEWFLDLNGNGRWDENDLWAQLGDENDRAVTGDWDGDGKDDIGIYGPMWQGDMRAIEREPGLPDPENPVEFVPKNVPPNRHEATSGERLIRLTSQGAMQADVIDHVFRYGAPLDTPVSGDWNGDGIDGIGIFRAGKWKLDTDGDGRFSSRDTVAEFGRAGDRPVVGDFDGDGVHELGIYRDGTWMIDSNGNRELDAHDRVFEMGGTDDTPVVGDWNGDGIDEPGLYRAVSRTRN